MSLENYERRPYFTKKSRVNEFSEQVNINRGEEVMSHGP
jgi:hypothetical protein